MLTCSTASAKSQPSFGFLLPRQASTRASRPSPPVSAEARSAAFMRGPLPLVMDNFNDWDLQAVVRSCSFASHAEEPAAGAGGARLAHVAAAAREAEANAPAPPDDVVAVQQERRAPAARAAPVARQEASSRVYGLEYLDLDHRPLIPPSGTAAAASRGARDDAREVMISFPAASTSGVQQPRGRKAGARTPLPRPKRSKKSQVKKVVREMPVGEGGVSSSDPWAWRKYGQKPIKGSPYPRGYYKCSSMKGCMARKLVERSPAKPGVLIVTYVAEHCHPAPAQLNALAGTTRHTKSSSSAATAGEDDPAAAATSPRSHDQRGLTADEAARCDTGSKEAQPVFDVEGGRAEEAAASAGDESEVWPAGMDLDELLATTADDDFDLENVLLDADDDGVLGRRLSL